VTKKIVKKKKPIVLKRYSKKQNFESGQSKIYINCYIWVEHTVKLSIAYIINVMKQPISNSQAKSKQRNRGKEFDSIFQI
jgi:hypothetical protein